MFGERGERIVELNSNKIKATVILNKAIYYRLSNKNTLKQYQIKKIMKTCTQCGNGLR